MTDSNYPQIRRSGLVVQEMPDELLVYDLESSKAHCLNDSAAMVWRYRESPNSLSDIVKSFEASSGSKVTEDFVWLAIDQLNEKGLLENGTAKKFAGHSRREVLKKIGLASMVALPVIASLVAPQNALASSSCSCTTSLQCQTPGSVPAGCPMSSCNFPSGGICV